jgi:hypothetical protein
MKTQAFAHLISAPLLVLAWALPLHAADTAAATTCQDGTTSTATGRGACSGHGGVRKASATSGATAPSAAAPAAPAAAAPAATPPPATTAKPATSTAKSAPTGTADATGATAKCKDGTYSKSQTHSGTCSSHGGVAQWLNAPK